ncbi:MAG TPA: glycoside hydrolase family 127 protein [Ferruginibacter sp.]|nr:glycoside hydrolase family 127 protein [Ferruginibacter sp.]
MKRTTQILIQVFCIFLFGNSTNAQDKLYNNEFPLSDVKLLSSSFQRARDLNIKVLLKYDADRLLAGYRKEAGLPVKAKTFSNWDGLDGHIGGHYLSALAMNYATTKNAECKKRMDYMLAELKACQEANGMNDPAWAKGYVGAVPNGKKIWSSFQQGHFTAYNSTWVPWYNVHKMYAGLRDAWLYTGNNSAKDMFLQFCDWGINITASLTDTQMQSMLDMEHGGMNEIFADAYQMTGDKKYLTAAKRFSHHMLLDAMALKNDNLDNKHANTQVPKVLGFERIGELANEERFKTAGDFFWETVTAKRSLAFGGNSRREFFPAVTAASDFVNDVEGPESCNSYNMLKLTEHLFRLNPLAKYADYYERTLYNHILSTQHPEHGGYVYFTPARPRHYRVYSAPNAAMWCCVGSGMENHGKYNQFIYTRSNDSLYINLFVASELNWREKKIKLSQQTLFPSQEKTSITITEGASVFSMMIRYPSWVKEGALKIKVNGKPVSFTNHPSSYITVKRLWKKGDVITVILPMHNSIEYLPNVSNYIAIMHGPVLLAAKTETENLKGLVADDSRWGHIAGGKKLPLDKAPIILEDNIPSITNKLKPVAGKHLTFSASDLKMINPAKIIFEPFYKIHDSRYMMYWMALSNKGYLSYLDSVAGVEKQKLELEKRTIDFVAPGEQQPEADHFIQKENSHTGNQQDEFWRDANNEGYFSYQLSTNNETSLSLLVKYWGAEWGTRKFDIYIDDEKLLTEDNTGKWNQSAFHTIEYKIPDAMVKGKNKVRVKFQALPGATAGAVYYIRLTRM